MNRNYFTFLGQPSIYTKSKAEFWNDEYISKQMLKAHLNPNFDGASRKLNFIQKSVEWIKNIVSPNEYPMLLDIGCGPGIYAEMFTQSGYCVTGVDFSMSSIEYAKQSALNKKLDITYLYQNYLEMEMNKPFDLATMIYCDYGALSANDRRIIMKKIYNLLRPGGKFLLDVFSLKMFNSFQEQQTWEVFYKGGFWRADEYLALNGYYKYSDNVTLELISIITNDSVTPYYLWNTYFSENSLVKEVENFGFKVNAIFSDVAGNMNFSESETIAIILEKQ